MLFLFVLEFDKKQDLSHIIWHQRIIKRVGVWRHLLSPMYISVVLFLSVLLLPAIFLPVTWFPWVYYVTGQNEDLCKRLVFFISYFYSYFLYIANKYTLAFNLSTIAALFICPCSGTLLEFRTGRSKIIEITYLFLVY